MKVGGIAVTPVDDGIGHVTPGQLYAAGSGGREGKGTRDEDWEEHREFLSPDGELEMPVGTFVIRSGDRLMLVDAGYGPQAPPTVSGPRLPENLAAAGVRPEDVTDVVLTHLHADHIGWCAVEGEATFPSATYRCAEADWTRFVDGAGDENAPDAKYREVAAATLGPIKNRFEMFAGETTLAPGVDIVPAPGHTPGSSMIVLSGGGERALLIGDVVHHPVQLLDDAWERVIDVDEARARAMQIAVARDLVRDGTPVVGAHFPGLRFGRVVRDGNRRRWAA
ncbi:hydrolase [Actinomadura sp. NBRC 104412]|uniref:MBL fold metallo-hydrolase n=1 Tax=Actinomadura sp. NBRC 104412 TaxID=3032203 RepID=UPI00249FA90D|nr:MBL fold metallo-hydrolase [Actinomadura sp. NBRC 104412]GLZ02764.1 hydrolase [Actinomadura sp. NBRC 104412]